MNETAEPNCHCNLPSEAAPAWKIASDFCIELPCMPLEELDLAKSLAAEVEESDFSIQESYVCVNQEGEEVSILLGADLLAIDDDDSLQQLRHISLREDVPIVLYTRAAPSYRKGFWPDEEDDWIEQDRDFDFWEEHLKRLLDLRDL